MKRAYSHVELLIVCGVVLLLGAVFGIKLSQADTLSDLATARTNMVLLSRALEAYKLDYGAVPNCNSYSRPYALTNSPRYRVLERLSTPVAYIADAGKGNPFLAQMRI